MPEWRGCRRDGASVCYIDSPLHLAPFLAPCISLGLSRYWSVVVFPRLATLAWCLQGVGVSPSLGVATPRPDTFCLTLPDFDALADVLGRFESFKLEGFCFWADEANYNTPQSTPRTERPVRLIWWRIFASQLRSRVTGRVSYLTAGTRTDCVEDRVARFPA